MCTGFIVKAQDGSPLYGRTMEWGGFDLHSELVLVPRGTSFTSALSGTTQGMTWKNQFGFIAINAAKLPVAADGINETGLTIGVLYLPGFAQYQDMVEGEEAVSLNNTDLAAYILGQFDMTYQKAAKALVDAGLLDQADTGTAIAVLGSPSVEMTFPAWAEALVRAGLLAEASLDPAIEVMEKAGMGAIIALLFAPESGQELRADIRAAADKDLGKVQAEWQTAMAKTQEHLDRMQAELNTALHRTQSEGGDAG